MHLLSGGRETDSIWSSISLDSPTRCRGKQLHLRGNGTVLSHLSNPRKETSIVKSSQIQTYQINFITTLIVNGKLDALGSVATKQKFCFTGAR